MNYKKILDNIAAKLDEAISSNWNPQEFLTSVENHMEEYRNRYAVFGQIDLLDSFEISDRKYKKIVMIKGRNCINMTTGDACWFGEYQPVKNVVTYIAHATRKRESGPS